MNGRLIDGNYCNVQKKKKLGTNCAIENITYKIKKPRV